MRKKINYVFCFTILCASALSAEKFKQNSYEKTMPSSCYREDFKSFCEIEIGYLLENMNVDDFDILMIHTNGTGSVDSPTRTNSIKGYDFGLTSGLRASLAKSIHHDEYSLKGAFEWMSATSNLNLDVFTTGSSIVPISVPTWPGTGYPVQNYQFKQARNSFSIDYFLLDVFLSKTSYTSSKFMVDTFAGLKNAWLGLNARETYFNPTSLLAPFTTNSSSKLLNATKSNFWGIGPMFGFDGSYCLFSGLSIFGYMDLAVLLGQINISDRWGVVTTENLPGTLLNKNSSINYSLTLRNIIGLKYDKYMGENTKHLTFKVGFDTRYYTNAYNYFDMVAQAIDTSTTTSSTDLTSYPNQVDGVAWSMGGLIVSLALEF
jgi:hypothetical protein